MMRFYRGARTGLGQVDHVGAKAAGQVHDAGAPDSLVPHDHLVALLQQVGLREQRTCGRERVKSDESESGTKKMSIRIQHSF